MYTSLPPPVTPQVCPGRDGGRYGIAGGTPPGAVNVVQRTLEEEEVINKLLLFFRKVLARFKNLR